MKGRWAQSSEPVENLEELFQRGFRYALALTHEPDHAAELVQDACVACLAAQAPWGTGYLFAAIRSRFVDQYRRRKLTLVEPIGGEEELAQAGAHVDPREDELLEAGLDSLDRALGRLRAEERETLFLAAVEGYTAREIAALTGRPRGTVLSVLHRARRKIRDLLRPSEAVKTS
ncbi:MAG: RNA polymerase sigma factor [bacterium]|nr:RNA polymerase subunit sigma-70 [Deltaproteobacteria bacterium]MCP4908508.1 RNA polymerase sigma factor [bacterium]